MLVRGAVANDCVPVSTTVAPVQVLLERRLKIFTSLSRGRGLPPKSAIWRDPS